MRLLLLVVPVALVSCSSSPSPEAQQAVASAAVSAPAPAPTPAPDPSEYLAKMASEPGAVKTPSGLIYKALKAGTGASPKASDMVKVNYRGTLTDGTEFDASSKHGGPVSFPLNQVIPCWTEGVQMMKVGGKAQLVCPSSIAYGANSPPPIPPNSTLVFEVELISIGG